MDCPACAKPLVAVEYNEIEVDYCPVCRGVWLDAGELELLLGVPRLPVGFFTTGASPAARREARRRCPECGRKMEKAASGGDPPVILDRCTRGDGLWLDRGELESVLAQSCPPAGAERITSHLRELFTKPA